MSALSSAVVLCVLFMTVSLPLIPGAVRRHFETVILIFCTIGTLLFFQQIIKGDSRAGRLQSQVTEERAESALKLMTNINVGVSRIYEGFGSISDSKGKGKNAIEMSSTGLNEYFKKTLAALTASIKANPADSSQKAKLIVLLNVWNKHNDLKRSTCEELVNASTEPEKELGRVLWNICVEPAEGKQLNIADSQKIIETKIIKGWYHDNAFLALYKTAGTQKQYKAYSHELEDRYMSSFCLGVGLLTFGAICAFIGLIVLVINLGTLARKEAVPEDPDNVQFDIPFRSIYAVFVGWMCSQLAIGEAMKLLPKNMFSLGTNPLGMCVFSFVTYFITMLPALILIYYIAIKPSGLDPLKALKLRIKTNTSGPFKLVLFGFLSWCAIIPCVLAMSVLSGMLGSQGSDNPVLAQIALVAGSKNIPAIIVMALTVAALAPLCEEIIFRAFLYSSLKTRIGVFPAILVSSFIFAGIHMDLGGMLMLLALGPVLALALERSRSLLPSMIAHGMWNGGSFALALAIFYN